MKNILSLILFLLTMIFHIDAQNIISFTVSPLNPTTSDSISIIIECEFNTGSCDGYTILNGITGNEISASGFHCQGMLQFICTDYDTIKLVPQAAGTYSFIYNLYSGNTIPCNPGPTPGDIDSVEFTVTGAVGIKDFDRKSNYHILNNPETGNFEVRQPCNKLSLLKIYSSDGKFIHSELLKESRTEFNLSLSGGIYIILIENQDGKYYRKLQVPFR